MSKNTSIATIISGIVSVVMSFTTFFWMGDSRTIHQQYGGDAYTGIQNAAADAANNISSLNDTIVFCTFSLLLVIGITLIAIGAARLVDLTKEMASRQHESSKTVVDAPSDEQPSLNECA